MTDPTPAPAPATDTPPLAASTAAVLEGNFSALQEARIAERHGKPLDPVPTKAAPPTPAPVSKAAATNEPEVTVTIPAVTPEHRELSARQKKANEATRLAVEQATADLRAENARLKQASATSPAAPATIPEYKRFLALPDAPKFDAFESIEEHSAAMAVFVAQKMREEWTADQQAQQSAEAAERGELEKITAHQGRITAAGGMKFLDALSPEVQKLQPVEAIEAKAYELKESGKLVEAEALMRTIGPRHVLTSEILKSALSPQVLQRLHDHPEELARFDTCKDKNQVLIEFGKLEARVDTPPPVAPKTVTSSHAPTHVSGTRSAVPDTAARAYASNDFRAFREHAQSQRDAQRRA